MKRTSVNNVGMPDVDFTYKGTPKEVKEYFVNLLGKESAKKLMTAMRNYQWIIISGPKGPTGKTTLADVLRSIGYTYVIEDWLTTTIRVSKPLADIREKNSIFEELRIS